MNEGRTARVVVLPVLFPGYTAITIGRTIFVKRAYAGDRALLAHELVHVEQWQRLGAWRFLTQYLGAYLRHRRAGLRHWDAYRAIPFEEEARRRAGR